MTIPKFQKTILTWYSQNKLTLGLDLRGGSHLLLEVDTSELVANKNPALHEQIVRDAVEQSLEVVRRRLDETGMVEPMITRQGSDSILVQLPGVTDRERALEIISKAAHLEFKLVSDNVDDLKKSC